MEVRYLIIARFAEFAPDGKLNLIGGDVDQFIADSYPYIHNMIVAATKLVLDKKDGESEHPFRAVIVLEETGEIIAEGAKGTIPRIPFPEGADKLGSGFVLPFANVIFSDAGRYVIQMIIDDTVMAKAPFRVAPTSHYQKLATSFKEAQQGKAGDGSNDSGSDQ